MSLKRYNRNSFEFSEESKRRLSECHPDIIRVCKTALGLGLIDITVTEGRRGRERQNALYKSGKSKLKYPASAHNSEPSSAADLKPYIKGRAPGWNDFAYMAGIIQACAILSGAPLRWGGNWDMDGNILADQAFDDGYHFELAIHNEKSTLQCESHGKAGLSKDEKKLLKISARLLELFELLKGAKNE